MLTAKLLDVAQRIMDSYYQDFAPADAFFKLDDFGYWLGRVYEKNADDVAQNIYKLSLAETGTAQITFSQDWWKSKEYEVQRKDGISYIDLDIKYMGFKYDTQNSGIQLLMAAGNKGNCGNYIRTTLTEIWQLEHVTTSSNVWWYIDDNKIFFRFSGNCNPTKVKIFYIPKSEDENFDLPKSEEFLIATTSWNFMIQAKAGVPVIDSTNNLNRNVTVGSEIDKTQLQPL